MIWLLYLLALFGIVVVLTAAFGKLFGRGEMMPELADNAAVVGLNRAAVSRHDYDSITFDTVVRGYRQDQVDAVIGQLIAENNELRRKASTVEK